MPRQLMSSAYLLFARNLLKLGCRSPRADFLAGAHDRESCPACLCLPSRSLAMRSWLVSGLAVFFALPLALAKGQSVLHDWPQWRGPSRDAVSTETGLL